MTRTMNVTALILTTALATGPVFAQTASQDTMSTGDQMESQDTANTDGGMMEDGAIDPDNLILAEDLEGADIYSDLEDGAWSNAPSLATIGDDWQPLGSVESVVLDSSGKMVGVIGDIGGFFGIGDKHVLMPIAKAVILPHEDDKRYTIALDVTKAELESLPKVEKGWFE